MTDMETNVTRNHRARRAALITPLILVNTAAVYGQGGWAWDHLVPAAVKATSGAAAVALCLLFAAAVESIGIYLAAEAHAALMAGDASARLRLSSYAVGGLVGTLNYAHFAGQPGYRPNPLAVTFGLLSAISPWLWSIHSRSLNRDRLRDLGQVDPRAVRFSPLRWVLFPVRTWRAFRLAVWAGIVSPVEAVKAADARRGDNRRPVAAVVVDAVPDALPEAPAGEPAMAALEAAGVPATDTASEPVTEAATVADVEADTAPARKPAVDPPTVPPRRRTTGAAKTASKPATGAANDTAKKVARWHARMPDATNAELAAKAGVSVRSVERYRPASKPATTPANEADTEPVNGATVALATP